MRRTHHELLAWQWGIELVKSIYTLTATFPASEAFGLVAQMRRAAISVPSNIAEGAARESKKEFAQFLIMARGSLSELETQLRICVELGFSPPSPGVDALMEDVFRLVGGLLNSVRRSHVGG